MVEVVLLLKVILPMIARRGWGRLAAAFPRIPAHEGVLRREFESFTVGGLRLGHGVHVEVDDEHLHLVPAALGRFLGCGAMSVPWSAMELTTVTGGGLRSAMVDGVRVIGPRWCMDLAETKGPSEGVSGSRGGGGGHEGG